MKKLGEREGKGRKEKIQRQEETGKVIGDSTLQTEDFF